MNRFYQITKMASMGCIVGLLFFLLQGCQTPLVSVEVEVEECCKGGDCTGLPGLGACPPDIEIPTNPGYPAGGTYDGIQCDSGFICAAEGYACSRGKVCDTTYLEESTKKCQCKCTNSPD